MLPILADVTFTTEGIVVISGLLAALGGAVVQIHRQMMASKDRELDELRGRNKSFEELASESLKSNIDLANAFRARDNKPPIPVVPAVISEGHSPSTPEQRAAARLETMKAQLALVKREMGQEPRAEPEKGNPQPYEPDAPATVVDSLKSRIDKIPEKTAEKVVEKIEKLKEGEK